MDTDILFVVALIAFYVLQQLAGRRKQQQTGKPQTAVPGPAGSPDPDEALGDALSEIRRALGMETEPASRPSVPDEFHRVDAGMPDREERFESRLSTETGFEDRFERRGAPDVAYDDEFERAAPYHGMPASQEDRFERSPTRFADPLEGHSHLAPIHVPLDEPLPTPAPRTRPRRLTTKSQLREAFVLTEIVGPPRARRRELR